MAKKGSAKKKPARMRAGSPSAAKKTSAKKKAPPAAAPSFFPTLSRAAARRAKKKALLAAAPRGTLFDWTRGPEDPPIMMPPERGTVSSAEIRRAIKKLAKERAEAQQSGSSGSRKAGS